MILVAVKVADIMQRKQSLSEAFLAETLHAQEVEEEAPEAEDEEASEEGEEGSEEETVTSVDDGLPVYSESELEVLQRLSERRKELQEWQKDLEIKENVLNLAQTKIDQKIEELRTLKSEVQAILADYNDKEDKKTRSLVKIYENMKPKAAAKIFATLDTKTLLRVVGRMKEPKVAAIMGNMEPENAKLLTQKFAQHGTLPEGNIEQTTSP